MPAIVIDAGGTYLRCGICDDEGNVSNVSRSRIPSYLQFKSTTIWPSILNAIVAYIERLGEAAERCDHILFAVPGPVAQKSRLLRAPTIAGPTSVNVPDIQRLLSERTGRNVILLNDVSAAAWHVQALVQDRRFLVVTVSSGIGSKMFDRRNALGVFDDNPGDGEIGHVVVNSAPEAPLCDCGVRGHLGAISSGRGTERFARRFAAADRATYEESSLYKSLRIEPDSLTNEEHIVPAACAGDRWARAAIATAAWPLAGVLAGIIAGAALDRVIVIGGFAQSLGSAYEDLLSRQVSSLLPPAPFTRSDYSYVRVLDVVEDVGLAGAARLYRSRRAVPA